MCRAMAEAPIRQELADAIARVANLEAVAKTMRDDMKLMNDANIQHGLNTTALFQQFLGTFKQNRDDKKKLNHTAAKNIDTVTWAGNDDKTQSWNTFKRTIVGWCECLVPGAKEVLDVAEATDIGEDLEFINTGMDDETREDLDHALYWKLSTKTSGAVAGYLQGVPWNSGLAAWQELCAYAAPRSMSDRQAVYAKLMDPKEAVNVATMAADLAAWEREVSEFEARFEKLREDEKVTAAKKIVPRDLFRNRLLGTKLDTYDELRRVMRAIGLDRALAVREERTKGPGNKATQKGDPMDVDALTQQHRAGEITTEEFLLAIGVRNNNEQPYWSPHKAQEAQTSSGRTWRCKGEQYNAPGASMAPSDGRWTTKGGKDGKGKGKYGKGEKGKGKGRGKQCFNCKGFGHMARDCPSERDAGKGMSEVGEDQVETDEQPVNDEKEWHQEQDDDKEYPMMTMGLSEPDYSVSGIGNVRPWSDLSDHGRTSRHMAGRVRP